MRMIAALILTLLAPLRASATAQVPDRLVYEGQVCALFTEPLESLWATDRDRRPDFRLDAIGTLSTGNWRGYVAVWEIEREKLYLCELRGWIERKEDLSAAWAEFSAVASFVLRHLLITDVTRLFRFPFPPKFERPNPIELLPELFGEESFPSKFQRVTLKGLFGEQCRDGRVEATWFTGELRIPDGELLQYVHMGYESVHQRDLLIRIERGRVTGRTLVDNTKKPPSRLELAPSARVQLRRFKDSMPRAFTVY